MRVWLLTNTTYGTWLPGSCRGSVTSVRDVRPGEVPAVVRIEHDAPGEPCEEALPGLEASAREQMTGPPIVLDRTRAEAVLAQFHETARFRGWALRAVAVMYNHFHIVVQVPGDPCPKKVLAGFKAYATRVLNRCLGVPPSETWWTEKGSKRKLRDDAAVRAAIHYVAFKQPDPLALWFEPNHPGEPGALATGVL